MQNKNTVELDINDHLITPDSYDCEDYKVSYKGQDITSEIIAIIRVKK